MAPKRGQKRAQGSSKICWHKDFVASFQQPRPEEQKVAGSLRHWGRKRRPAECYGVLAKGLRATVSSAGEFRAG